MICRRPTGIVAVVALVPLVAGLAGCDDDPDTARAGLEAAFDSVGDAAGATDLDGPNQTTSKDITYVTGTGVVTGSPDEASAALVVALEADGWDVGEPEASGGGVVVVAVTPDGAAAAQVGLYSTVGTNAAPAGSSILQIQVADIDAGLAWTPG